MFRFKKAILAETMKFLFTDKGSLELLAFLANSKLSSDFLKVRVDKPIPAMIITRYFLKYSLSFVESDTSENTVKSRYPDTRFSRLSAYHISFSKSRFFVYDFNVNELRISRH